MAGGAPQLSSEDATLTLGSILVELTKQRKLLEALNSKPTRIGWGGGRNQQEKLENWPIGGQDRILTPFKSRGSANLVIAPATYTKILPTNGGRGGISLINIGANPCFIYLANTGDAQTGAVGAGYLFPNGGDWDGKITHELWCGPVTAYSTLGTTLVLAEI